MVCVGAAAEPPRKDAVGARAMGTRAERGQADRGTGGCGSIRHPWTRSKSPDRREGSMRKSVAKFASRGVGCADHVGHEMGHVPPPLMPFVLSGRRFSILRRNTLFAGPVAILRRAMLLILPRAAIGPRGPQLPGTVTVLSRFPATATLAHRTRGPSPPKGAFGAFRSPRGPLWPTGGVL